MAHRYGAVAVALVCLVVVARPDGRAITSEPVSIWRVAGEGQGTPAVDRDSAYFLTRRNDIVAADRVSGRVRWRASLGLAPEALAGSRVVTAGDVVVAGGHDLVALDRTTGGTRWVHAPADEYGFGFYLGDPVGDVLHAGSASGQLRAWEAGSGRVDWSVPIGGRETTVYTPAADAEIVAAFTDFGNPDRRGLVVVDRLTGRERWRVALPAEPGGTRRAAVAGGPVLTRGFVILSTQDGAIHAFDRADGRVRWTWRDETPGSRLDFRPLVLAGRRLIAGSLSGEVLALDADSGRVRWRVRPSEASVAFAISASDEVVYVPYVSGVLVAVEAASGRERWRTDGAAGVRWAPRVAGRQLFASASESGFLALADEAGDWKE